MKLPFSNQPNVSDWLEKPSRTLAPEISGLALISGEVSSTLHQRHRIRAGIVLKLPTAVPSFFGLNPREVRFFAQEDCILAVRCAALLYCFS
jgi:hypothetical protein